MQIYSTMPIQNGTLKYQIQVRQLADSSWQGRHVWLIGSESFGIVRAEEFADKWMPVYRAVGLDYSTRSDCYKSTILD